MDTLRCGTQEAQRVETATFCLRSTFTLSATVAGLGIGISRGRARRLRSARVVVRLGVSRPGNPVRQCATHGVRPGLSAWELACHARSDHEFPGNGIWGLVCCCPFCTACRHPIGHVAGTYASRFELSARPARLLEVQRRWVAVHRCCTGAKWVGASLPAY